MINKKELETMFGHFLAWIPDSRHVRQSKYTVLHDESDFQVKNKQLLRPEGKNKEKRNEQNLCFSLFFNLFFLRRSAEICQSFLRQQAGVGWADSQLG